MDNLTVAIPAKEPPPAPPDRSSSLPSSSSPWPLESVQLTPPYSPSGKAAEEGPSTAKAQPTELRLPPVHDSGFPSPVTPVLGSGARWQCCERHLASAASCATIVEGCVGSRTPDKGIPIPAWATGMTPRELDLRLRINHISDVYRARLRELSEIKKRDRRHSTEKSKSPGKKAGFGEPKAPGRPVLACSRKRRISTSSERQAKKPLELIDPSRTTSCSPSLLTHQHKPTLPSPLARVEEAPLKPPTLLLPTLPPPVPNALRVKKKAKAASSSDERSESKTPEALRSPRAEERSGARGEKRRSPAKVAVKEEVPSSDSSDQRSPSKEAAAGRTEESLWTLSDDECLGEQLKTEASSSGEEQKGAADGGLPNVRLDTAEDLRSGIRVMVLDSGLLYAGTLNVVDAEALLYSVHIDGQRSSNQPILCLEELTATVFRETRVKDPWSLRPGFRIAAFWSGQIRALYPGTVRGKREGKRGEPLLKIEFDDGDEGWIAREDLRHLPQDFPITKVSTPVLPSFISRSRSSRVASEPQVKPAALVAPPKRHSAPHPNQYTYMHRAKASGESGGGGGVGGEWEWLGEGKVNLKRKRTYFQGVKKGPASFSVGDVVHLAARGKREADGAGGYVGRIQGLWEPRPSKRSSKRVTVSWLYRAKEVALPASIQLPSAASALFKSSHTDENSVETISSKASLKPYAHFVPRSEAGFYLAGSYDPVDREISWEDDIRPTILTQIKDAL